MMNENIANGEEVFESSTTSRQKTKKGWSKYYITIEPIRFCIGFTIAFTNGVTIDMLQRNVCHTKYNVSTYDCMHNLSPDIKSSVEGITAQVNMLNQMAQGLFPLIIVLFVGPWSDTNGRKPFIIWPILGYAVYYLCWTVFAFFPDIPVMYLFIPSVPLGMTGGMIAMFVCMWSHTCDNFDMDDRPMRFSICVSIQVVGGLLGNALSGQVVRLGGDYGYQIVFITSLVLALLALIYGIFILEETVVVQEGNRTKLCDFENAKSTFIVMFVRPEKGLLLSVLILLILMAEIPLTAGDDGILYLVGKTQFSWDLNEFNLNSAISSVISALSPIFFVWFFMKILKVSNISMLIIASSIIVFLETLKALSVNEIMFWITTFAVKTAGIIGPSIDAELSYIVSENNIGKAFTLTSMCDAFSPLISIPFYTLAYNLLLPTKTLYVFFISAFLGLAALVSSVALYFKKSSVPYTRQSDEDEGHPYTTLIND